MFKKQKKRQNQKKKNNLKLKVLLFFSLFIFTPLFLSAETWESYVSDLKSGKSSAAATKLILLYQQNKDKAAFEKSFMDSTAGIPVSSFFEITDNSAKNSSTPELTIYLMKKASDIALCSYDFGKALYYLEKCYLALPEDYPVHALFSAVLTATGLYDQAEQVLTNIIAKTKDLSLKMESYHLMVRVYLYTSREDQALATIKTIMEKVHFSYYTAQTGFLTVFTARLTADSMLAAKGMNLLGERFKDSPEHMLARIMVESLDSPVLPAYDLLSFLDISGKDPVIEEINTLSDPHPIIDADKKIDVLKPQENISYLYWQTGKYSILINAQNQYKKLIDLGFKVLIGKEEVNGKIFYRVFVYSESDIAGELKAKGIDYFISSKPALTVELQ